ncbi:pentapeptide repeat-containing protein [Rothia sp. 27098_8_161]|uniref:pentapeptide repeat-containing protein n=1 Tax=Rothia sp. 27098_8_161 TaxID=3003678 RepID=UPI00352D7EA5
MQDQSRPTPTGNHESNGVPKSKIAKYRSTRIPGWVLSISLIIYGLISKFQDLLKNTPLPLKYDFLNILMLSILIVFFIIYMLILKNNSKLEFKKLIDYLLEDLKYLILPTGFIFALFSALDLKWFSDFSGFVSGILGIFGLIKNPSNNHTFIIQHISSDPQSQRHERTMLLVDNLRSENHYSKINAIQGLASIADEWLSDSDIPKEQARKSGQNIINILCNYIQSMPDGYTDNQLMNFNSLLESDKKFLEEEAETRQKIFHEFSSRIANPQNQLTSFKNFTFNFKNSPIFYPLENLRFANANFKGSKFYIKTSFTRSTFIGNTNFSNTIFNEDATFGSIIPGDSTSKMYFIGEVDFSNSKFKKKAHLGMIEYADTADFESAIFSDLADFTYAHFYSAAVFSKATFHGAADFCAAIFESASLFTKSKFKNSSPQFAIGDSDNPILQARFSCLVDPNFYDFSVSRNSNYAIRKSHPLSPDGQIFTIPDGAILFTPTKKT